MTQEEMNLVINAAIAFGMNNDMSGELHDVKIHNLQLLEENAELKKEISLIRQQSRLLFMDASRHKPEHGKLYLCIVGSKAGSILDARNFVLLKYNDKAKYWDERYADVDDADHDDGVCDYGDHRIQYFAEINPVVFAMMDTPTYNQQATFTAPSSESAF